MIDFSLLISLTLDFFFLVIDYDKKTDEELKELEDDLDEEFMTELRFVQ